MARPNRALALIINYLDHHHQVSPQTLLAEMPADISRSAIMRNLARLLREGQIIKRTDLKGNTLYELASHHHAHFMCLHCQAEIILPCHVGRVELPEGYRQQYHQLEVYGICPNCRDAV